MKRKLLILLIILLSFTLLIGFALFQSDRLPAAIAEPAETPAVEVSPMPTPAPTPVPAPEPTPVSQTAAEQLTLKADVNAVAASHLFDDDYYSDYTFPAGTEIKLTADEEICSLYIIFGSYPDEWTLRTEGGEQLCGQNGFLHEYVSLEAPSKTVSVCLPDYPVLIRDIYAFTDGYLPSFVQTWQTLEGGADILVFSTHYDDELLFLGGLIPYYSAVRGLRVQVCYMTSNYLTDFSNYRFRPHEALNGLWVCGDHFYPVTNEVDDYQAYSYWDAVDHYGADTFLEFQVEMIRRFKPLVVVTQAEDGEYGHGAHVLTALSAERAVDAAYDPEQFPESAEKYGIWDTPKIYLHYYGDPEEITWLSYEVRAPELGWRTPFQVAQEAYRQHVTQQQWESFYVYGFGHSYDCHRFGLYRSLVGKDVEHNDLMEHVSRDMYPFK